MASSFSVLTSSYRGRPSIDVQGLDPFEEAEKPEGIRLCRLRRSEKILSCVCVCAFKKRIYYNNKIKIKGEN